MGFRGHRAANLCESGSSRALAPSSAGPLRYERSPVRRRTPEHNCHPYRKGKTSSGQVQHDLPVLYGQALPFMRRRIPVIIGSAYRFSFPFLRQNFSGAWVAGGSVFLCWFLSARARRGAATFATDYISTAKKRDTILFFIAIMS
jgi:hypothetical protein